MATQPADPTPVRSRSGHDNDCELVARRYHECRCASRTYARDQEYLAAHDVPWGLFAFERDHPDTRGH